MKVLWPQLLERVIEGEEQVAEDPPGAALGWLEGSGAARGNAGRASGAGWGSQGAKRVGGAVNHPYHRVYEVREDRVEIPTLSHQRQRLPTARGEG